MSRFPGATWRPVVNVHPRGVREHRGLVLHVQVGDNSPFGWFNTPSAQASSDFWVSKTGEVEQYVETGTDYAWAQAQGDPYYASVETEGYPTEALTEPQVESLARIYAWGHTEWGWPLQVVDSTTEHGFTYHGVGGAAWGGHYDCPGVIRRGQRQAIIDRAAAIVGKPAPAPTPAPAVRVSLANVIAAAHSDPPAPQGAALHRDDVLPVERALQAEGLLDAQWVDGSFGTETVTAYGLWQQRCGFSGTDADGIPGYRSLARLGELHGFTVVA